MRPELLRRILALVERGAVVAGPKPMASPSLADYPNADDEVAELAAALWGDLDGVSRTLRNVGDGIVVWGRSPDEILELIDLPQDLDVGGGSPDAEFAWLHRRAGDIDIYYVASQSDEPEDLTLRLRVAGREAEIWRPDSGAIEAAGYTARGERTDVALQLAPRPLLLQTGFTDKWSDPYGEFLAARAATPVYELLGASGIEEFSQPPLGEPMMNTLGYLMHDGGHGVIQADWAVFLEFMDRHLKP